MSGQGICVCFASGKGGAGKTSLAAGIGAALAALGKRVLCVDCDPLRNLDLAMGMAEQAFMDFGDVAAGRAALEEAAVEHPRRPGLFLLNAPAFGGETLSGGDMRALAAQIRARFDFCLLDAPAGVGEAFRLALAASDRVLVVAGADALSRRAAQRVSMELGAFPAGAARLIVNRVRPAPFRAPETTVDDIMDYAGLPLMGLVPEDAAFSRALRRGLPVTVAEPKSAASRACARIARRVAGENAGIPPLYR